MSMVDVELAMKASEVMKRRTKQNGLLLLIEDDMRFGFIMVTNLVYAKTESRYFVYTAQDAFAGEFWLDYALETIRKSRCGLLAFNDGRFFGKIAVFGLADRQWVNTIYGKFIFHHQYKSHFADTELSVIASQTSNLVFNSNAILLEVDYEKHLHGNNENDHKLYIERAKTGFDGRIASFIVE
ncbi:MAG: hypothetical protein LBD42_01390 [Desulfovibrio sp.]|jgi:hypothetical protein|nr:hypothetical protein [Desulfovibrio sp.]